VNGLLYVVDKLGEALAAAEAQIKALQQQLAAVQKATESDPTEPRSTDS
jgi:hypothetical protein